MRERRESASPLERMSDTLEVQPVGSLKEALGFLPEAGDLWGFWTTPAEARLERRPAPEWPSILTGPRITEARVFDEEMDLHWRGDRGVCLRVTGSPGSAAGLVRDGGWLQRNRRSRLWGEWLAEAGGWYEERIPDPQRYGGLKQGPENCLAFLVYREYVFRGTVEHVRYRRVEGEPR